MLDSLAESADTRHSYTCDGYILHYIVEDGFEYICLANPDLQTRVAFNYLNDVKKRFTTTYGDRMYNAHSYQLNGEFGRVLSAQMNYYSNDVDSDKLNRVQSQISDVKNTMVDNIGKVITRGKKLDDLMTDAEHLKSESIAFKKQSNALKKAMWMKNMKLLLLIVCILITVAIVAVWLICGFPLFDTCRQWVKDVEADLEKLKKKL